MRARSAKQSRIILGYHKFWIASDYLATAYSGAPPKAVAKTPLYVSPTKVCEAKNQKNMASTGTKEITVNWALLGGVMAFFDVLKIVLYLAVVGAVIMSIINIIVGGLMWFALKKGGVATPFKDIRGSYGMSIIPIFNLFFQSWLYRTIKLKKKYDKVNAAARKQKAGAVLVARRTEQVQVATALVKQRQNQATPIASRPPPPRGNILGEMGARSRVGGVPLVA